MVIEFMAKWAFVAAAALVWACTVPADLPPEADAGDLAMGGSGGALAATGGRNQGGAAAGAGGVLGMGGVPDTGGAAGADPGSGGAPATGGMLGAGGTPATGGTPGTGGVVATGGTPGTGGMLATGGTPGTGGTVATGGSPGTGGTPVLTDTARFNFEASKQNWVDLGVGASREAGLPPVRSADRSYAGDHSLRYPIVVTKNGTSERLVGVVGPNIGDLPQGQAITFQVWVPTGHKITALQAFVQTRAQGSWQQDQRSGDQIGTAAWTQMRVPIPASFAGQEPLELGVRVTVNGPWLGDVYIDSIRVQ